MMFGRDSEGDEATKKEGMVSYNVIAEGDNKISGLVGGSGGAEDYKL